MSEGLTPYDFEDSEFDRVEERVVPCSCITLDFEGFEFRLTPANAAVRLFFEGGPDAMLTAGDLDVIDELELDDRSRVVIHLDDGSVAPQKLDDDVMRSMVKGGFPFQVPEKPDETDEEFMDTYMRIWSEDAGSALGLSS